MKDRFLELLQSNNCKQVNAALLYSQMMKAEQSINWDEVDQAIIVKWSKSGLKKIRIMAWQLIEGEHLRFAND